MAKVFNISYASVPGFPAGTVVASIQVHVNGPQGDVPPINVAPDTASVPYDATVVGDYSVTVQAIDANGSVLGTPAVANFTVSAPQVISLSLPASVSVADAP